MSCCVLSSCSRGGKSFMTTEVPSIVSDIWTLLVGDTLGGGLGNVTLLKEVHHYGWALSILDLSLVVAALSAQCPQLLLQATCCRQLPRLPQHHRLSLWNPNNHSSVSCLDHSAYHSRWKITNIIVHSQITFLALIIQTCHGYYHTSYRSLPYTFPF